MRKIFHITILSVILLSGISVQAQLMQFEQGKKNFMDGQYYKALEFFTQAISQARPGNEDMLTEAYYYRGLTYIRLHGEAFTGDDKELQKKFEDALLLAFYDFKSSLRYDKGSYWQKVDLEMKNMHHLLLAEGLKSLNEYNDLVYNGKTDQKKLKRAEEYLTAAYEIRDTYLVNDLLGQVCLDKGQKPEAKAYFTHSIQLYTENLPDEPDFLMAYVFYRLAAIDKQDSIRIAIQAVDRGLNLMRTEYDRYRFMRDKLTEARAAEMQEQYELAVHDLDNIKLDLYLSSPDLYIEALHVFEEQIMADPENEDLLIGYASLLERTDKEKAIETYHKVLLKHPDQKLALFNIGALYYGKGREMFELAQGEKDSKQFKILTDEAMNDFDLARPYFEKVIALDPNSLDAILALKTIAYILDEQDDYLKYQQMEEGLKK